MGKDGNLLSAYLSTRGPAGNRKWLRWFNRRLFRGGTLYRVRGPMREVKAPRGYSGGQPWAGRETGAQGDPESGEDLCGRRRSL